MNVYEKKQLVKPSFFQRLFKKHPKQNFIIELENILAENEDKLLSIKESEINLLKDLSLIVYGTIDSQTQRKRKLIILQNF